MIKFFKCTDCDETCILSLLSDVMNIHFKTPLHIEMDNLEMVLWWAWEEDFPLGIEPSSAWCSPPEGTFPSEWAPSWKKKGQALGASSRKWGARGRLVSERPSWAPRSQFIEFACFSALWILSIYVLDNQVHFNHYSRHFLSEALCCAWEAKSWEGKVKLKSVLFHSNTDCLTFSQLFKNFQ